jgi:hypothetical protein
MTPTEAERFIGRSFNRMSFNEAGIGAIPADTFAEVLDAIEARIPFPSRRQNEHLARFLWAGCRRFNRWFAPSPYVVPESFRALHKRFTSALRKIDGPQPVNSPVFEVHVVRDCIYQAFSQRQLPLDAAKQEELEALRHTLTA